MEYLITDLDNLKQKEKVKVTINNIPVLVFYFGSDVYAIKDKCPHMGSTLSNGIFKEDKVFIEIG